MKVTKVINKHKLVVAVGLTYILLGLVAPSKALEALSNTSYYLIEMLQIMPVIFLLTVAIDVLVPKAWIMKNMGEGAGARGGLLALLLGSVSAGPIYAAFPVTKMLLKKGASVGNVVIILSAWAVVKIPMLANEAKFLGPKFMATRWVFTVMAIFMMGWVMNRIINRESLLVEEDGNKETLYIEQSYCTGCGLCTRKVPDVFELQNKKAQVIGSNIEVHVEGIEFVVEKCPSKAIHFNPSKNLI